MRRSTRAGHAAIKIGDGSDVLDSASSSRIRGMLT